MFRLLNKWGINSHLLEYYLNKFCVINSHDYEQAKLTTYTCIGLRSRIKFCVHIKVKKMPLRCTVPAATAHRTMVVVVDGVCMCDDDEWGNLDDPTVQCAQSSACSSFVELAHWYSSISTTRWVTELQFDFDVKRVWGIKGSPNFISLIRGMITTFAQKCHHVLSASPSSAHSSFNSKSQLNFVSATYAAFRFRTFLPL